jgi:calcineurin-like phosphoesterase family protein
MNYFSSDFHLGHNVIVPKYRNFKTQDEHDELLLEKMSKLNKRDILFVLGDFIFDSDRYDYYINNINKMACRIKVIMGNHDSLKLYKEPKLEVQLPLFSYKGIWLSHCPIHPREIRNRLGNIHGHLHGGIIDDPRYFNVNLDNNNFNFVNFEEIAETLEKNNNGK